MPNVRIIINTETQKRKNQAIIVFIEHRDTEAQRNKYRRDDKVHRASAFLRGLCLL